MTYLTLEESFATDALRHVIRGRLYAYTGRHDWALGSFIKAMRKLHLAETIRGMK